MTIKVIQGFVRPDAEVKQPVVARTPAEQSNNPVSQAQAAQQSSSRLATTDAVVTTLRAFRSSGVSEPIKEFKEAEKLSKDVSERVKSQEKEALGAHSGLSSSDSAPVLTN